MKKFIFTVILGVVTLFSGIMNANAQSLHNSGEIFSGLTLKVLYPSLDLEIKNDSYYIYESETNSFQEMGKMPILDIFQKIAKAANGSNADFESALDATLEYLSRDDLSRDIKIDILSSFSALTFYKMRAGD
jgi:hypothetical protein